MKKILFIVSLVVIALSCKHSKRAQEKAMKQILPVVLTNDFAAYTRNNADIQIINAVIVDSTLSLSVRYSGGCKAHTFELIGSKIMQKSFPPIRSILLIHHSNGDDCREVVEQTLKFNVSDFKYSGDVIMLGLKGWRPKIKFQSTNK